MSVLRFLVILLPLTLVLVGRGYAGSHAEISAYGAKCNGVGDDRPSIERAVNSLGGKGKVHIPGDGAPCLLKSELRLSRGVTLEGDGVNVSELRCTNTAGACIVFGDNGGGTLPRIMQGGLRDLTLSGNGHDSIGVYLGGDPTGIISPRNWFGDDIAIQNAEITGFGNNIQLGNNAFLETFNNVLIYSARQRGFFEPAGIENSGENVRFFGGQFNNNAMPFELGNVFGDTYFYGTSFDFNRGPAVGKFLFATFYGCHFEQTRGAFIDTSSSASSGNSSLLFEGCEFLEDGSSGTTAELFNLRGPLDQLTISHSTFGSNHAVSQIVNLAAPVSRQMINIESVKGHGSLATMPKWLNVAKPWSGLHISPANPTAPAVQGSISLGSVTAETLPDHCRPGEMLYCSDCKSAADGGAIAAGCTGAGHGSIALCKGLNSWTCGQ